MSHDMSVDMIHVNTQDMAEAIVGTGGETIDIPGKHEKPRKTKKKKQEAGVA